MKRRLLSAFLAVMMVLTMAPVAFAADGGEAVAQQGTSVSLPTDNKGDLIISDDGAVLDGTKKIYTNGTITVNAANVTIKNLTFGDQAKLVVNTSGKFTLTGCTFAPETVCDKATKLPVRTAVTLNVSEAEVTNNTFEGVTNGYYNAIEFGFGASNNDLSKAVIRGNTFNSAIRNNYFSFYNMTANAQIDIVNNKLLLAAKNSNGIRISNYRNVKGVTFNVTDDEYTYAADSADDVYEGLILLQDFFKDTNVQNFSGITINVTKLSAPKSAKRLLYVYDDHTQSIITTNQPKLTGDDSLAQFYAAKVGDTYYKTLAEAVSASNNNTVTLLKNTVEDVVIPADKTVTLDLNGKNIKPTTGDAIVNKGNLTIVGSGEVAAQNSESAAIANFPGATANVNGGAFVSAHWYVIKNLGNMTIDGPVTIKKPEGNTDTSSLIDNGWYGSTDKVAGESVSAQADKAKLTIKSGKFTGKSGSASCSVIKNDDYATLDISGGTFDSTNNQNTSNATTILNWNVATISGGTFIGQYPLANGAYNNAADKGQFTISGGTFTGLQSLFGYGQGGDGVGKITITDGNFAAPAFGDWGSAYTMEISGGYFTTDPSKYLATSTDAEKKYIAKAVTGDYKFHVELADKNDLQVVPVAGATSAPSKEELEKNNNIPSDKVDNIVTAAKAVSAPEISKAAQEVAANISNNSNTLGKQYQDAAQNEVPNQKKIEVRTYLEVKPKAYNKSAYTLDITPKYDVVVVGTKDGATAEKVVASDTLKVTNATNVSIQLPADFVENTDTLYVQHKGHEYDAAVTANNGVYTANFTNPDGFSEFTISKTSQSVAKVGNNKYTTLQNAIDAAQTGATIVLQKNCTEKVTVAGKSLTINRNSKTFDEANVTVGSNCTKEVKNDTIVVTYTKPSSGGSSGGSSSGKTTYKVTTSAVNNGGVNASPSSAEKGATITITLSPDKGYKLDKLTVTDGSGKTVSTVKKSDTVYTFTMPASAVKVGVSYVKATETPSKTKFNDVSANDWFASAVDYVTGKGMMNGTADNTFSPKANTTRGMVVTVLYRLENQPSTSAASFTDVASGAYYANAVAWANANGIVSGYGSGKFGPNDKVTREQLAAILYRYAQYKKYDVSVGEDTNILSYDDAQSISSYAIPAIQWACGAGVVTGKSGSKLDPKGNATRAEVAAMLMRFCENVK